MKSNYWENRERRIRGPRALPAPSASLVRKAPPRAPSSLGYRAAPAEVLAAARQAGEARGGAAGWPGTCAGIAAGEMQDDLQTLNAMLAKRVEEERAKALRTERLLIDQARYAAMGEMIGNVAHQWRQPLSTLGLLVQNLRYDFLEGRLGPQELEAYVAKALHAIDQMSRTIDDFRDFFRPGRRPEAYSPFAAIVDCGELVGASLKANNIALAIDGERDVVLCGYAGEFSQIILNLVSNAKDALVERRIESGRIEIAVRRDERGVIVSVRDNAGGIPDADLPRIFDPYFTTKANGTGIGLYMARTIVERHMRGTIRAENTEGGALFVLTLPRDPAPDGTP